MKLRFSKMIGACALLPFLHALPAAAQTALQPGTIVGTFTALGNIEQVTITVPNDRNARVTDIKILGINNASACLAYFGFPTGNAWFVIAPNATIIQSLNSGYGLVAGSVVHGYNSLCAAGTIWAEVRGFYFTIP